MNNRGELSAVKQAFGDNLAEELIKTYDGSNLVSDSQQDLIGEKYLAEQIKLIQEQQRTSSILDKWSHLLYQGEQDDKHEEEVSNAEQEETEAEHEEISDQTQEQHDQNNEEVVEQQNVEDEEEQEQEVDERNEERDEEGEEGQPPSVYLNNSQPNETIDTTYSYLVKESQQQKPTQLRLSNSGGNLVQSSNESQRDTEGEQNDEEDEDEEQDEEEQEEDEEEREQEEQDHEQEEHETEVEEQEPEEHQQVKPQGSTLNESNYVTDLINDNEKIHSQVHSQSQMGGGLEPRSLSDFKLKAKQNEFRGTESRIRTDARGGAGASQSDYQHSRSNHQQHGWSGQQSHTYMPQFSSSNLNSVTIDAYNSPQFKAMLEQLTKPLNVPPEHVNFPPEWPSQDKISILIAFNFIFLFCFIINNNISFNEQIS